MTKSTSYNSIQINYPLPDFYTKFHFVYSCQKFEPATRSNKLILNRYTTAQTGIKLLTTKTDVLTASETLCRSSAAVPGLLSPRVNLRVSTWLGTDMSSYKL